MFFLLICSLITVGILITSLCFCFCFFFNFVAPFLGKYSRLIKVSRNVRSLMNQPYSFITVSSIYSCNDFFLITANKLTCGMFIKYEKKEIKSTPIHEHHTITSCTISSNHHWEIITCYCEEIQVDK